MNPTTVSSWLKDEFRRVTISETPWIAVDVRLDGACYAWFGGKIYFVGVKSTVKDGLLYIIQHSTDPGVIIKAQARLAEIV